VSADGGNAAYRITLPEFEGPLDLLLHLCKTHELDIVNIPIAFITRKYLEYLEVMQSMSVDVAADYLVMAATLAYLKSRELVPTPEPLDTTGEEGGPELDPREELIRRLLEYQKYKNAAEQLGGRPIEGRTVFPRGMPIDKDDPSERPFGEHSVWKLIEAFGKILEKAGAKALTHDVVVDRMSIGERIGQLADRLREGGGSFRFDACFDLTLPEVELRNQVVVTLLAILELARLKAVRVLQSPTDDTLFITRVSEEAIEKARHITITSAVEVGGEAAAADDEGEEAAFAPPETAAAESVDESVETPIAEAAPAPIEAAPAEAMPAETAPAEATLVETAPVEATPVEARPVEEAKDEEKHEEA
jgi:segregation and condensation protein A